MWLRSGLTEFHRFHANVLLYKTHGAFILIQGENSYPFEALLNKDPASFGNWDEGWTDQVSVNEESNLLQNGQEDSTKVRTIFVLSTSSSNCGCSVCLNRFSCGTDRTILTF